MKLLAPNLAKLLLHIINYSFSIMYNHSGEVSQNVNTVSFSHFVLQN